MEEKIFGGYTPLRAIDAEAEEKNLFDQVIQHISGAQYVPLAVATQVVNGMNYAFLCLTIPIYPKAEAKEYNTLVIIHKPLPDVNEAPSLLEIRIVKVI